MAPLVTCPEVDVSNITETTEQTVDRGDMKTVDKANTCSCCRVNS